jgi:hypothetical protein
MNKDLVLKQISFFFSGAVVPASLFVAFNTLVLGHCDPKFGCAGTLGLLFKISIVPIALASSIALAVAIYVLGKTKSYHKGLLFVFGAVMSLFNLVSFRLAQDIGFSLTIAVILATTVILFAGLSRLNITTRSDERNK